MLNPLYDVDIHLQSLLSLFTIFLRIVLILLYIYWPVWTPNQESWSSIIWRGNRSKVVSVEKVSYDYECFDCTFTCASREEMNLHSRLCMLDVSSLQFTDHHIQ